MIHHGTIIFMYIYVIILRCWIQRLEKKIDEENITPSDFAVMVTGLPVCKSEEFKEHLEKKTLDGIEVQYINFAYKIDDYVKFLK